MLNTTVILSITLFSSELTGIVKDKFSQVAENMF